MKFITSLLLLLLRWLAVMEGINPSTTSLMECKTLQKKSLCSGCGRGKVMDLEQLGVAAK
jgi:hypothetical protein